MNYFSHYFFDHKPGNTDYNFGLSLPDFVRNFLPGQRLKSLPAEFIQSTAFPAFAAGATQHFQRDHRFHASQYFKQKEQDFNSLLKPLFQQLEISRYWFASHILAEMMIDRVLMKRDPQKLDSYYTDLAKVDLKAVHAFLQECGLKQTEAFEMRFNRFVDSRYLKEYVHDPALLYSLNRIYIFTKAGNEWSKEQYTALLEMVPIAENIIFESIDALFQEML